MEPQYPQLIDREAEQAVIGCAFMGSIGPFGPEIFSHNTYRDIWRRIKSLELQGKPIDIVTVAGDNGEWAAAIGQAVQAVPSTLHAESYFQRVRDLAARRAFVHAAEVGVKEVWKEENPLDEILGRHYSRLSGVSHGEIERARHLDVDSVVEDLLSAMAEPREVWGMRSGWPQIDTELGGVHTGETILLAGTPGAGKSIFTAQMCAQLAGLEFWSGQMVDAGKPGAIFQLEMSESATITRLACALAKVSFRQIKRGKAEDEERDRYLSALERLAAAPIFISDDTQWSTDTLRVEIAGLIREHSIRWVLIDYAGKLKDHSEGEIGRERKISQGLADISKMGIAMVVVEQLNKQDQVYGSIQKQYDADVILKLQRVGGGDTPKDMRRLLLEKAREADISMRFDVRLVGPQKRFERWEDQQAVEVEDIPF